MVCCRTLARRCKDVSAATRHASADTAAGGRRSDRSYLGRHHTATCHPSAGTAAGGRRSDRLYLGRRYTATYLTSAGWALRHVIPGLTLHCNVSYLSRHRGWCGHCYLGGHRGCNMSYVGRHCGWCGHCGMSHLGIHRGDEVAVGAHVEPQQLGSAGRCPQRTPHVIQGLHTRGPPLAARDPNPSGAPNARAPRRR